MERKGPMGHIKRLILLILFLIFFNLFGTIGYMILLDVSFIDGLYMTVITISTVGYTEVAEMTKNAQIFSILLIATSVGTVGFVISKLGAFFKFGYLTESWRRSKMEKQIANIKNHYIICGAGETGHIIINQFKSHKVPFVVIEKDEHITEELEAMDVQFIIGDATHEEVLENAKIMQAKGLVASLGTDSENVFVVLTARQMHPDIHIVARAIDKSAHGKLKKAGADNTVSPNEIGGRKMAAMMLKPSTTYFIDNVIHTKTITLDLEEIEIKKNSELCDKTLEGAQIQAKTGLIVLAIRKEDDEDFRFNPGADEFLEPNDKIIVIGKREQIEALSRLAKESSG